MKPQSVLLLLYPIAKRYDMNTDEVLVNIAYARVYTRDHQTQNRDVIVSQIKNLR